MYLTLADTYLPLDTAFPNSATRLMGTGEVRRVYRVAQNGLTPSLAQYSHEGLCSANGFALRIEFVHSPALTSSLTTPQLKAMYDLIRQRVWSLFARR